MVQTPSPSDYNHSQLSSRITLVDECAEWTTRPRTVEQKRIITSTDDGIQKGHYMARLRIDRDKYMRVREAQPNQGHAPMPEGVYLGVIEAAEIHKNRAGTGEYLKLKWRISDGDFRGRIVWDNITTSHQDAKSNSIGLLFLGKLCDAVGLNEPPNDTDILHGRACDIHVIIREQEGFPTDNRIRDYSRLESSDHVSPVDTELPFRLCLRDVRVEAGLSQAALAEIAGTTQSYVSRIESGVRVPSLDVLADLARALGCTLDSLVILD